MGNKKFSKKLPPKHVQNTIAHFWERFCAFLDFWKFFDFLKTFRRLDPPWNTGQKMFTKKLPQNMFKTRLDNLGTILGLFGMLKVFYFKKSISKNRLSAEQWAIKNFRKNYPQNMFKTQLHTFGNDFVHFWTFENFSIFWKHFEDSTLHGTLGKKCLRKNYPKTCSKHVWTIWERFWAFSECWKFLSISKNRLSAEQWAIKNFRKNYPQNMFKTQLDTFGNDFGAFLDFWKFFDVLKTFRRLDPPWNTGQKKFTKKLPKNMFRTRLDTFGNDFGHFWTFENFSIFWKHFEDSTFHGTLGKKKFRKNYPQNMFKTRLDTFGNEFGHFWNFENFLIF